MSELQTTISPNTALPTTDTPLSEWIFERVREFVTGRVLEIATTTGNLAPICLQNSVTTDVISIDLADESFNENYAHLLGSYDTVIALHIAYQITNNKLLVVNCKKLLKRGGHLITRLPARTALYNGLDQGFNHWKEYNLQFINKVLRKYFIIMKTRYFIVAHDQFSPQWISKYSERVTFFNESNARGFNEAGLFIVVVGKRR